MKKATSLATSVANKEQPATLLQRHLEYFSRWFKAKSAVAVCFQYRKILLNRARGKQTTRSKSSACEYDSLDIQELNVAEQEIIRHVQKESFKEEISKLKNLNTKEEAKGARPFSRLDPFLDWNNLVRIGGRIK